MEFNEYNKLMNKMEIEHRYMEKTDSCCRVGVVNKMKDSEGINQRTYMHGPRTWTTLWGLTEGE